MRRFAAGAVAAGAILSGAFSAAHAAPILYDAGNGLTATADFQIGGDVLTIVLTNTSTNPFGGQDGDSNMVLSSLNFDLPTGVNILGGNVVLGAGSNVVQSQGGDASWAIYAGSVDLNEQYGFSNTGVGNSGTGVYLNATSALTSHNNGGNRVTAFSGGSIASNGLNYGLVADGSADIGNDRLFVQDTVMLTLLLSAAVNDLAFLDAGSYVEFGSDFLFTRGTVVPPPPPPAVPEPSSLLLLGSGGAYLATKLRQRRRQTA